MPVDMEQRFGDERATYIWLHITGDKWMHWRLISWNMWIGVSNQHVTSGSPARGAPCSVVHDYPAPTVLSTWLSSPCTAGKQKCSGGGRSHAVHNFKCLRCPSHSGRTVNTYRIVSPSLMFCVWWISTFRCNQRITLEFKGFFRRFSPCISHGASMCTTPTILRLCSL